MEIEERLAIADEAKRLLGDKVFNSVLKTMLADYLSDLIATKPGTTEANAAHAGVIALEGIKKRLKALENDGAVLRSKGYRD